MKLLSLLIISLAAFGQTANYPATLDSNSSLFVTADNVQTSLTAAMTAGATSVTVSSTTGFTANMIATICDVQTTSGKCTTFEHMFITAVTDGTHLAVTRGFAGTTGIAHTSGKFVSVLIDAAHQKTLKDAVLALETALGANPTVLVGAASFNWSQTITQTVTALSSNTITLTPCPLGFTSAIPNNGFYFHLSGGTGSPAAEDDLITATTCTSGATTGTITFTSVAARSGSWTAASSYGGNAEAAYTLPNGGVVFNSAGTITFTASLTVPYSHLWFTCLGSTGACTIKMPNSGTFTELFNVTTVGRVRFENLKFDGNFINTSAVAQRAIYAVNSPNLNVINNHFVNFGYVGAPAFDGTKYGNSAAMKCSNCVNARIADNRFNSDWVQDIVGTGDGADIRNNRCGTPKLTDVGTNVNYWDTQAGGLACVDWANSDEVKIVGNQVWGTNRFYTPSFAEGNPILATLLTHSLIDANTVTGMTPVPGTCTISGTGVTCTKGIFDAALDVGAGFECETTVGTISRITAVGSTTTATLTAGPGNQTASRCRMQIAGDLIQTNGLTDFRITNNSLTRSADMGLDVNMYWDGTPADNVPAQRGIVTGNLITDGMVCGLNFALGQVNYVTITGNTMMNNHRGTNSNPGGRGGICLSPTPDNVNYYTQSYLNFTGNSMIDTASTQTYGVDVETTSFAGGYVGINIFADNLWSGGTAFSNVPLAQSMPQTTAQGGGVAAGFLVSSPGLPNSDATATLITYTAAQMVDQVLIRTPSGGVSDVTATAALLVAQLGKGQAILGSKFSFTLRNTSGGANTVTITAGSGVTLSGTMTIAQNFQRTLTCFVTNAAASAEAVTCYSGITGAL